MELKTTEEFVREAHSAACSTWKTKIEKEFPELFEKKLIFGKWYVSKTDLHDWLMNYQGNRIGYGFNTTKEWRDNYIMIEDDDWIEATNEEIESALIAEVKNKYKIPCRINYLDGRKGVLSGISLHFNKEKNALAASGYGEADFVFQDGIWAEILPKEKTTISKEKALKILAKKLKVSPESIEIN